MADPAVTADVAVEGVRFRVTRAGRPGRTPVLLLHGVPQTSLMWRDVLADLGQDRPVVAADLKGLGESEAAPPYELPSLVQELAALVLHEFDRPADLVGHDWGGILALGLAAARPDVVRRLVVISAPYRRLDYRRAWHVPLFRLPLVPEAAFAVGGRSLVRAMLHRCWRSDRKLERDILETYTMAYADPGRISAMLGYYRGFSRRGLGRARVERALVVWGAQDPVLPLWVAESVVRDLGPGAALLVVPGAGHLPVEEAPEVVVPAIRAALSGAPTPAPERSPERSPE